jgi:hypothetical protein
LYYGDAESHLDIARRIVDSRTPGYDQIGTAWLPLTHALMLPFVLDDRLWRSGLAGAIPSSVCFVGSGILLFVAARRAFNSMTAGVASLAVFALNPNLLYLQGTPMTEPVFFLGLLGLFYSMICFRQEQSWLAVFGAGIASLAASLTRYEGWFIVPFAAAFFFFAAKPPLHRLKACATFILIAALGPAYWLAHNAWYFGDALAFYRGPYSAKAIQGTAPYPGYQDWAQAWIYYRTAVYMCVGSMPIVAAVFGLIVAMVKRVWWPVAFFLLPPLFYIWSLHSSGNPIHVPQLPPYSFYNTRYGLAALPVIALCAGAGVLLAPVRYRALAASVVIAAALGQWGLDARAGNWICWEESQVNSESRRAWTHQAAQFFTDHYRPGTGIFSSLGDLAGIYREAGIPLRQVLQEGNGAAWDGAIARPDLFLHEEWAVAIAGDTVASTIQKASLKGPHYERVRTIIVKDAPAIEIFRRN